MSRASQLIIGAVSAMLGVVLILLCFIDADPQPAVQSKLTALSFGAAASFCVTIACWFPRSRSLTMRLIGAMLVYGGMMIFSPPANVPQQREEPIRRYLFASLLVMGGGYLSVTGKYPSWGLYGEHFKAMEEANSKQKDADTLE